MKATSEKHYIERKCAAGRYVSVRTRYRSQKMTEALEFAKRCNGVLVRHKWGLWSYVGSNTTYSTTFLSTTIHALVRHGLAEFTKFEKSTRGKRIPVEMKLKKEAYT